jgi:hypothetical protein
LPFFNAFPVLFPNLSFLSHPFFDWLKRPNKKDSPYRAAA